MIKSLTALAVALFVTAVLVIPFFFWYEPHEVAVKVRAESMPFPPPRSIELRIMVHDWLMHWWYLIAIGAFSSTFAVLTIALRGVNDRNCGGD